MRIVKFILAIVVIGALGAGYLAYNMNAAHEPIADFGQETQVDALILDESFRAAIDEVRAGLIEARADVVAPALSLAVSVNGELVWAEAHGYADAEGQVPLTRTMRFPIGSVSKTITAVAAAQLWEQGALDLDADIHEYLPDYPALDWTLTTRQLLSHQGGIRHYAFAPNFPFFSEAGLNEQFDSVAASLSLFSDDPLLFEPDTNFSYSTYGYTLASAVIEQASGADFLSYLQDTIFAPLDMDDTQADYMDRPVENRVSDYISRFSDTEVLPRPDVNTSYKWAGGGLISTPTDLVTFGSALVMGEILSPETMEVMFSPREISPGELNPQRYGLGWRIAGLRYPAGTEETVTLYHHGGTAAGGITILMMTPDSNIVVAMAANSTGSTGSSELVSQAADIIRVFLANEE